MFKIVDKATAWWPVKWTGVTGEGRVVENRIEMQFELLDADAVTELRAEGVRVDQRVAELSVGIPAEQDGAPATATEIWADFVLRFCRDWRGVGAANGEPLPFCRENLIRLLKVNGVFSATCTAINDCLAGKAETRAGN
jgi:hypothetical protein